MTYRLDIQFADESAPTPTAENIREVVREFDPNFTSLQEHTLRLGDPASDEFLTVTFSDLRRIAIEIPDSATVRSLAAGYAVGRGIADRLGGTLHDPQLEGPPDFESARDRWRKRNPATELARIFSGRIPSDLKIEIKQRRGLLTKRLEIRGSEVEVHYRQPGRSVHFYVPILSLQGIQEMTVPNPRPVAYILLGLFLVIFGGIISTYNGPAGGIVVLAAVGLFVASAILIARFKRKMLVMHGRGGALMLEAESPSKEEVREFLSSIDRIKFALTRPSPRKSSEVIQDDKKMRVV